MIKRRAECSCGQLSITCTGEPVRVSVCHCLACKRRTGSAFSFNARFPEANVAIEGHAREFTRVGDEGGRITYSFCPDCGTTVHYRSTFSRASSPFRRAASPTLPSRRLSCRSTMTAGVVPGWR